MSKPTGEEYVYRWVAMQHDGDQNIIQQWQHDSYAGAKQHAASDDRICVGLECKIYRHGVWVGTDTVFLDKEERLPDWFNKDHEVPKNYHLEILRASKPVN